MGGDPLPPVLEVALMEEAQPGGEERDDSRGFLDVGRKDGSRPRLVVVLEETGQLVLVVEPGVEMLTHRPGVTLPEPVVEPLVVVVFESSLLQRIHNLPLPGRAQARR